LLVFCVDAVCEAPDIRSDQVPQLIINGLFPR
jgi:hypothetical protein